MIVLVVESSRARRAKTKAAINKRRIVTSDLLGRKIAPTKVPDMSKENSRTVGALRLKDAAKHRRMARDGYKGSDPSMKKDWDKTNKEHARSRLGKDKIRYYNKKFGSTKLP